MAGPRITDDQCLERYRAYKKFGSVKAAAEALGVNRQCIKLGVDEVEKRGLIKDEPDIILPDFPVDDIPIDRVLDLMEERSQLRAQSFEAHSWFPVKFKDDRPIGILWFGDPHLDDNGCDIKMIRRYADICAATDGLYGANIGDSSNNWSGRLAALYAKQDTSQKTARRLVEWFMLESGIKWALWLVGNHDAWGDGSEILARMASKHRTQKIVCHDWEARFILQFRNGCEIKVNAAHDFPGSSIWNPLHGPVKAAKQGPAIDLLVCGHRHNWAISQWEMAAQGNVPVMIRVKGFKTYDDYAMRLGHYEQKEGAAILTVINPKSPTKAGRVVPYADVETGVEYLKWLRSKN